MKNVTVRNIKKEDSSKIYELELKYNHSNPDSQVLEGEFYVYHPAFESGKNVFCAIDENDNLLAYCPLFPSLAAPDSSSEVPNTVWSEIMADPEIDEPNGIKDLLYVKMIDRAEEIKSSLTDRKLRLAFNYPSTYQKNINYILSKGFEHNSNIYRLERNLDMPIARVECPRNITIKSWKLQTTEAKKKYISSYNRCFPQATMTLDGIETLFKSSLWENGTVISAIDENENIVASVFAYFDAKSRDAAAQGFGMTEDIFVVPEYRNRGIAKCIITQAFEYLRSCGLKSAHLEVLSSNENALSLYKSLGYKKISQDFILEKYI